MAGKDKKNTSPRKWWRSLVSILLKFLRRLGKFPRWLVFTEMGWFLIFLFVEAIVVSGFFYFYGSKSEQFEFARTLTLAIGAVGGGYGLILAVRRSVKFSKQVETGQKQADTAQKQLFNEQLGRGAELLANGEMVMLRTGVRVLRNLAEKTISEPEQVKLIMQIIHDFIHSPPSLQNKETEDKEVKDKEYIMLGIKTLGSLYNEVDKSDDPDGFKELVNFQRYDLEGLNFNKAELRGVDFASIKLHRMNFFVAKLHGANFTRTKLQRVNFIAAKLQGATFINSEFQRVDFRVAELHGVNFFGAKLQWVNFTGAKLQEANFTGAKLQQVHFNEAQLQGADFGHAQLQGAGFDGAELEWADCALANFSNAENLKEDQIKGMIFDAKNQPTLPKGLEQFLDKRRGYEFKEDPDDKSNHRRFIESDAEWSRKNVDEWVREYLASIRGLEDAG